MITKTNIIDDLPQGPYDESSVFEWTVDEMSVKLSLADLDRLGCLFERAELKPHAGVQMNVDPTGLGKKLSYLGETLAIIEEDKEGGRTVLRSSPPSADDTYTYFFELVLDRNEGLSLVRHAYDRVGRERKMIPTPLTTHALGRLIDDLKNLASGN
ncbi:MAG TPA: hypothetical protein VKF36_18070 [Syntrophorhabdales bacterium]|nr:hypothetical protein [Syntrophorhabdales bacterium]